MPSFVTGGSVTTEPVPAAARNAEQVFSWKRDIFRDLYLNSGRAVVQSNMAADLREELTGSNATMRPRTASAPARQLGHWPGDLTDTVAGV
jgi:hypothetical protein